MGNLFTTPTPPARASSPEPWQPARQVFATPTPNHRVARAISPRRREPARLFTTPTPNHRAVRAISPEPREPARPPEYRPLPYIPPPEYRPRQNLVTRDTRPPCYQYARGHCSRGNLCRFAHLEADNPALASLQPRSERPCRFFAQGHCKKGDACTFSHSKNGDGDSNDKGTFEFGGAWATFDDGAKISKLSLPSDFSAIRISNLPQGSSARFVMDLLSDVGMAVSADQVRIMAPAGPTTCSAVVKADDPTFARTACDKLRTSITMRGIEVIPTPAPMPQGQSLHRVDCRKVTCLWHRPTRVARLDFSSKTTAHRVHKRFSAGLYKVLGNKVAANSPTAQGVRSLQLGWTLTLTALPDTVEEKDITKDISAADKPRSIEVGEPSYIADADLDATIVKSLLLEFGPLERWEVSPAARGKYIKAYATFFDESNARDAATSLVNKPLSFSETTRLTVRAVTSATFKVSTRVFDVVNRRLSVQKAIWERQHIRFSAFHPRGVYRILKLEGEDRRLVARAQETLQSIIGGEVVRMDGNNIWCANFRNNGDEFQRLKAIEKSHGVIITRDTGKAQFRVFGSEASFTPAANALKKLIRDCSSDSHIIELSADDFAWACNGGFRSLESQLGASKATFIISKRKCILIKGSQTDYIKALGIIASRQTQPAAKSSHSETECPACLCEAEEPIRTSCNHVYCRGCFANMCVAETPGSHQFCISCIGTTGSCRHVFTLTELRDHLPSETFEDVLGKSFVSYVRRNPIDFRYCPTPDCTQIYRVASDGTELPTTFTCTKCLVPTCTACHKPHPGRTCAEYSGDASGGHEALLKIKKQLGIKDCPRCKTSIEKTEGCNHMTCKGCGAHICWKCLTAFDMAHECYNHMHRVHGGIYDGVGAIEY